MTEDEVLALWQTVAGDDRAAPWGEDAVFAFFQRFRPFGVGLERAIRPLPRGEEVLARLRGVYGATTEGRGDPIDPYFVVRNPPPTTGQKLESLTRAQARAWQEIAFDVGNRALASWLDIQAVEVVVGAAIPMPSDDSPHVDLYEAEGDWHGSLQSACPVVHVLREAFYSIACDYTLSRYVTWPWYRDATGISEPFEAYFQLWGLGATVRFPEPRIMVLHLPSGSRIDAA